MLVPDDRAEAPGRYSGRVTQPDHDVRAETERVLAGTGIPVTDEGRERARAKLAAAAQRMTPQEWRRLEERFGRTSAA
jgi:hypothetical protein